MMKTILFSFLLLLSLTQTTEGGRLLNFFRDVFQPNTYYTQKYWTSEEKKNLKEINFKNKANGKDMEKILLQTFDERNPLSEDINKKDTVKGLKLEFEGRKIKSLPFFIGNNFDLNDDSFLTDQGLLLWLDQKRKNLYSENSDFFDQEFLKTDFETKFRLYYPDSFDSSVFQPYLRTRLNLKLQSLFKMAVDFNNEVDMTKDQMKHLKNVNKMLKGFNEQQEKTNRETRIELNNKLKKAKDRMYNVNSNVKFDSKGHIKLKSLVFPEVVKITKKKTLLHSDLTFVSMLIDEQIKEAKKSTTSNFKIYKEGWGDICRTLYKYAIEQHSDNGIWKQLKSIQMELKNDQIKIITEGNELLEYFIKIFKDTDLIDLNKPNKIHQDLITGLEKSYLIEMDMKMKMLLDAKLTDPRYRRAWDKQSKVRSEFIKQTDRYKQKLFRDMYESNVDFVHMTYKDLAKKNLLYRLKNKVCCGDRDQNKDRLIDIGLEHLQSELDQHKKKNPDKVKVFNKMFPEDPDNRKSKKKKNNRISSDKILETIIEQDEYEEEKPIVIDEIIKITDKDTRLTVKADVHVEKSLDKDETDNKKSKKKKVDFIEGDIEGGMIYTSDFDEQYKYKEKIVDPEKLKDFTKYLKDATKTALKEGNSYFTLKRDEVRESAREFHSKIDEYYTEALEKDPARFGNREYRGDTFVNTLENYVLRPYDVYLNIHKNKLEGYIDFNLEESDIKNLEKDFNEYENTLDEEKLEKAYIDYVLNKILADDTEASKSDTASGGAEVTLDKLDQMNLLKRDTLLMGILGSDVINMIETQSMGDYEKFKKLIQQEVDSVLDQNKADAKLFAGIDNRPRSRKVFCEKSETGLRKKRATVECDLDSLEKTKRLLHEFWEQKENVDKALIKTYQNRFIDSYALFDYELFKQIKKEFDSIIRQKQIQLTKEENVLISEHIRATVKKLLMDYDITPDNFNQRKYTLLLDAFSQDEIYQNNIRIPDQETINIGQDFTKRISISKNVFKKSFTQKTLKNIKSWLKNLVKNRNREKFNTNEIRFSLIALHQRVMEKTEGLMQGIYEGADPVLTLIEIGKEFSQDYNMLALDIGLMTRNPMVLGTGILFAGMGPILQGIADYYTGLHQEIKSDHFSRYYNFVNSPNSGQQKCLDPNSDTLVNLAYRSKMEIDKRFVDGYKNTFYVYRSPLVLYTKPIYVFCYFGSLKMINGPGYRYIEKMIYGDGKVFRISNLNELFYTYENPQFTCGSEPMLEFISTSLGEYQIIQTFSNHTSSLSIYACEDPTRNLILNTECPIGGKVEFQLPCMEIPRMKFDQRIQQVFDHTNDNFTHYTGLRQGSDFNVFGFDSKFEFDLDLENDMVKICLFKNHICNLIWNFDLNVDLNITTRYPIGIPNFNIEQNSTDFSSEDSCMVIKNNKVQISKTGFGAVLSMYEESSLDEDIILTCKNTRIRINFFKGSNRKNLNIDRKSKIIQSDERSIILNKLKIDFDVDPKVISDFTKPGLTYKEFEIRLYGINTNGVRILFNKFNWKYDGIIDKRNIELRSTNLTARLNSETMSLVLDGTIEKLDLFSIKAELSFGSEFCDKPDIIFDPNNWCKDLLEEYKYKKILPISSTYISLYRVEFKDTKFDSNHELSSIFKILDQDSHLKNILLEWDRFKISVIKYFEQFKKTKYFIKYDLKEFKRIEHFFFEKIEDQIFDILQHYDLVQDFYRMMNDPEIYSKCVKRSPKSILSDFYKNPHMFNNQKLSLSTLANQKTELLVCSSYYQN